MICYLLRALDSKAEYEFQIRSNFDFCLSSVNKLFLYRNIYSVENLNGLMYEYLNYHLAICFFLYVSNHNL